jgi:hypothetical protein
MTGWLASGEHIELCQLDRDPELDLGKDARKLGIVGGGAMLLGHLAELFQLGTRHFPRQKGKPQILQPVEKSIRAGSGPAAPGQFLGNFLKNEEPIDRGRRSRSRGWRGLFLARNRVGKAASAFSGAGLTVRRGRLNLR